MARGLGVLLLTFLAPALAVAQLADPTRPPTPLNVPVDASVPAEAANAGLQSVILRKGGRPAALINGEIVELGGKVGEMKLVKVTEDAVVLLGPGGRETLRLTPAAEKKLKSETATARSIGMNADKGEKRK